MITKREFIIAKKNILYFLKKAGIILTKAEEEKIEVADFGLGELKTIGLGVITYINTKRCCAKELILLPRQTCPEHLHPDVDGQSGKEETFRCRWGEVYLYVPGLCLGRPKAKLPFRFLQYCTVWHEIILKPGDQYTLPPNTKHWFQAGPRGAIISEFSTVSRDEKDVFTDPNIQRITKIREEE